MSERGVVIHPDELDEEWVKTAKEKGFSSVGLHPPGGGEAHKTFAQAIEISKNKHFRSLVDSLTECGIAVEYEAHSARYLMPAECFAEHPEWFRMNENGERIPDRNFCVSCEEGVKYAAGRAVEAAKLLYRGKPDAPGYSHRYFFWMDDAVNGACHCEKCRQYSPSEQQLIVMNAIIRELRKFDKDAELAYLAYADCFEVPQKIQKEDGIFLEFAPMDRDFHEPIYAETEKNKRQLSFLPSLFRYFGQDNAKLLEYWLDNSMFSGWKKPPKKMLPDNRVIEADMRFYEKIGFRELTTFACYLGPDYRELFGSPDLGVFAGQVTE